MQDFGIGATFAVLSLLYIAMPAAAQVEYRNLDEGRPLVTEDAYPVERYAFEVTAPYRFEADADGTELHTIVPEVVYGFVPNVHLGLRVPIAILDGLETDGGLSGLQLFGLYNFNTEAPSLPAISVGADLGFPVGSLGGEDTRFVVKAIATRSWGRVRAHVNVARGFGSEDEPAVADPLPRWEASAATDWTIFRSSLLLLAEIATVQVVDEGATEVRASIGSRWQWTPTLVLDLGITRRLSNVGPDIGITLGLSHSFAIPALIPEGKP
jgi:hypothetical protein